MSRSLIQSILGYMQQHPIPQNVTQYQFRLVGDMTLKQFLELAGGGLLAYLFFASNLIFIIKWPLIIVSFLFGAALAFFPLEDRPLDQWIINFVKAIYMPTRFIWQKTNKIPPLFLFEAHAPEVVNTITKTIKAPTMSSTIQQISDLSDLETTRITSLDSIFKTLPAPSVSQTPTFTTKHEFINKPTIEVRKLSPLEDVKDIDLHIPEAITTKIEKTTTSVGESQKPKPTNNVVFTAPSAPTTQVATPTSVPKNITLPASPKMPNIVTGVVVDGNNKLIEGAIVQILSADGIPARAMKTNSLGQFYTSTPLSSDTYVIEVDKEGLVFTPQKITINDTIFSPIELRATS